MLPLTALIAAQPVTLSTEVQGLSHAVEALSAETCAEELDQAYQRVVSLDPNTVSRSDLAVRGHGLAEQLFSTRLALQGKLSAFHEAGTLTEACVDGARRYDLSTRYLVDHLYMDGLETMPWLPTAGFTGPSDLRSGDILVTRGDSLSSSGIAHIGSIDSQFSHNAMVYVDPDGQAWTVEAYLEKGAQVQPLEAFLAHDLGRIVAIRSNGDQDLAAEAARMAFDRIGSGPAIDYDEAFDSDDANELFCSEIGPWAFAMAGGPTDLPLHRTKFNHEDNGPMFASMGITGDGLAAPADLLYDPRFEILGEWRQVEALESMRRQDAVVESLFRWMEEDGYILEPIWSNRATVDVGLAVRRIPLLGNALKEKVHPHGQRDFLIAGLALQQAADAMYADFDLTVSERDETLSWSELKAVLETLREEDRAVWEQTPRKAGMHRLLHPAG